MPLNKTWMSFVLLALLPAVYGCPSPVNSQLGPVPQHRLNLTAVPVPARAAVRTATPGRRNTDRPDPWQGKGFRLWRYIVIHHSATDRGNAEMFDAWHRQRGWDELGYHFVIDNGKDGPDGRVEVGSRWKKQKWGAHTGGTPNNEYNNHGVGICLVGEFSDKMPSGAQLSALERLVEYLASKHNIRPENVIGHCNGPNASTACPGTCLLRWIRRDLRPRLRTRLADTR